MHGAAAVVHARPSLGNMHEGAPRAQAQGVEWEPVGGAPEEAPPQENGMSDGGGGGVAPSGAGASDFAERARYIPLRLSQQERRLLRLLEAALSVSEYTDKVSPSPLHAALGISIACMCSCAIEFGLAGRVLVHAVPGLQPHAADQSSCCQVLMS